MALTEDAILISVNTQLEAGGILEVKTANVVKRDGVEIAREIHSGTLQPGDALTGQDARVVAIANQVWTTDVVTAYQAKMAAAKAALEALQLQGNG